MERSIVEKDIDAARPSIVYVLIAAGVLILSYCVNAMDRTLFPLLLTDVRREYGLGLPEAGLLSTIFTLVSGAVPLLVTTKL